MSYNIHHCNPPSKEGLIDVDAIAAVIKNENADVVALQEVDINTARSGKINQAEQLSVLTGLKYFYFAKAIDHEGGDYGVAILSRYPLLNSETFKLPMKEKEEQRVLALATVNLPDGKQFKFGSTHLAATKSNTNRLLQINEINKITKTLNFPIIIAGDFNADENSEVIHLLDQNFKRTCTNCKPTIPVINPKKTIDFIAYKPLNKFEVKSHTVIKEEYASDHLPVSVLFNLKF